MDESKSVQRRKALMQDSPREVERMIDNAATASQHLPLIDDAAVREAIKLNIVAPLQAEVAALKERLREYGHHKDDCDRAQHHTLADMLERPPKCTCGLDAALARGGPFERIADGPNTEPNGGQG